MELINAQPHSLMIIEPFSRIVSSGEIIEIDNKEKKLISDLLHSGFAKVEVLTKKEGDK